ncbi:MAG: hypothetical protein CMI54_00010 [Parcubacteria group bacterium]|nr:hypothetical protein [Parcubacteria group bacterium]
MADVKTFIGVAADDIGKVLGVDKDDIAKIGDAEVPAAGVTCGAAASVFGAGVNTGWADKAHACIYGDFAGGSNQNWYRADSPATPEQLYTDDGCGTAVTLSSAAHFYRVISLNTHVFWITTAGLVKKPDNGDDCTLDTTVSTDPC